ncbi:MAG: hypothetical protein ABW007_12905 [Chitinophagaceae bacterium]
MQQYTVTKYGFINTSEAYSNTMFIGNRNVVIPYISQGLMPDNPINGKQAVIDFSYYVLEGVSVMSFGASRANFSITVSNNADALMEEYISFGGEDGAEVKVLCSGLKLFVPDDSVIRSSFEPFVPFDRNSSNPNYRQNIDTAVANAFFDGRDLPEDLKQLLGSPCQLLSWTGDGVSIACLPGL